MLELFNLFLSSVYQEEFGPLLLFLFYSSFKFFNLILAEHGQWVTNLVLCLRKNCTILNCDNCTFLRTARGRGKSGKKDVYITITFSVSSLVMTSWPICKTDLEVPGEQPSAMSQSSSPRTSPLAPLHTMTTEQVGSLLPSNSESEIKRVFPQIYYQCRAEREATFKNNSTELGATACFGYEVGGETARIGSFEFDSDSCGKCFFGSRTNKGVNVVNQNICLSFDPSTLTCLSCGNDHPILGSSALNLVLSDQNFVANLSGAAGADACISVARMEDSGLEELAEFFCELVGPRRLPPGSVVCIGSGSHLHRVGVTIYAQDWNRTVS